MDQDAAKNRKCEIMCKMGLTGLHNLSGWKALLLSLPTGVLLLSFSPIFALAVFSAVPQLTEHLEEARNFLRYRYSEVFNQPPIRTIYKATYLELCDNCAEHRDTSYNFLE